MQLKNQKKAILDLCQIIQDYQYMKVSDETKDYLDSKPLTSGTFEKISSCDSMDGLKDFYNYILFYYGHIIHQNYVFQNNESLNDGKQARHKLPNIKSFYCTCLEEGITKITRYFGLSPSKLAENLTQNYVVNDIEQVQDELSSIASRFISKSFSSTERVIFLQSHIIFLDLN